MVNHFFRPQPTPQNERVKSIEFDDNAWDKIDSQKAETDVGLNWSYDVIENQGSITYTDIKDFKTWTESEVANEIESDVSIAGNNLKDEPEVKVNDISYNEEKDLVTIEFTVTSIEEEQESEPDEDMYKCFD